MQYCDFVIQIENYRKERIPGKGWIGRFNIWISSSPAGDMSPEQAIMVEFSINELQTMVSNLASRQLDGTSMLSLGRMLGLLLLPPRKTDAGVDPRTLFAQSYKMLGPEEGLRLRLRLPPELAVLPWEYIYTDRTGSGQGMDGFVSLDPRLSIVRHQSLDAPARFQPLEGDIKVVVALASPPWPNLSNLNLQAEQGFLAEAFAQQAGLQPQYLMNAELQTLLDAIPGTGIFHFAGHGLFNRRQSSMPGQFLGTGSLVFDDQDVEAEQLGINLRSNGVRLAFLGACNAGKSESISWWDGVAPALVKSGIPVVVAYQFTVKDVCAIAFSRQFYRSLAGGLSIEQAMAYGRIASYNADKNGRDWGNAVLYMRAEDSHLFAGTADPRERQQAVDAAQADIAIRTRDLKQGGIILGAEVDKILAGKLDIHIEVDGTVLGSITGAKMNEMQGGSMKVDINVDTVDDGGQVIGAKFGTIGGTYIERADQVIFQTPNNPGTGSGNSGYVLPEDYSASKQSLQAALEMAQRALMQLETQVAGYTSLSVPVHLQIELDDKRKQVADLKARLKNS